MCVDTGAHIEIYKPLILLFFIKSSSLKRRVYAGLGDVGALVFSIEAKLKALH